MITNKTDKNFALQQYLKSLLNQLPTDQQKEKNGGWKSHKVMKRWVHFNRPFENTEAEKLRGRITTECGSREEQAGTKKGVDCKGENSAGPRGCKSWR